MTDSAYEAICQRVWALYQQVGGQADQGDGVRSASAISWVTNWAGRCTINASDRTWD